MGGKYNSVFIVLLLLFVVGCQQTREPYVCVDCNIVLITVDTLRQDHLPLYGYERDTAPFLSAFAKSAVVYDNAYTVMPHTRPSHATMLTGQYPFTHGVLMNTQKMKKDTITIASLLEQEGYATGAFVSAEVVNPNMFPENTFQEFISPGGIYWNDIKNMERNQMRDFLQNNITIRRSFEWLANDTNVGFFSWLEKHQKEKFFAWIHYWDPHAIYYPPFPYNETFTGTPPVDPAWPYLKENHTEPTNQYDGEILFIDESLKELVGYLEDNALLDNTVIIFVSDHGELLGRFDYFGHGFYLYEDQVKIPLLIRHPNGYGSNQRVTAQVSNVNIAPTIFSILGKPIPGWMEGRNIAPLDVSKEPIFIKRRKYPKESTNSPNQNGEKYALIENGKKYIYHDVGEDKLYDLIVDPLELHNLINETNASVMKAKLLRWVEEQKNKMIETLDTADEETLAQLRALGYVA